MRLQWLAASSPVAEKRGQRTPAEDLRIEDRPHLAHHSCQWHQYGTAWTFHRCQLMPTCFEIVLGFLSSELRGLRVILAVQQVPLGLDHLQGPRYARELPLEKLRVVSCSFLGQALRNKTEVGAWGRSFTTEAVVCNLAVHWINQTPTEISATCNESC